MKQKTTPQDITKLKKNEVFVFGSNLNGNHAGGAARLAVDSFGAIMGQPEGIQGKTYAIPTLDKKMQKVSLDKLQGYVDLFNAYTLENPTLKFFVTEIGCGIAGFTHAEIAPLFKQSQGIKNIALLESFLPLLSTPEYTLGFKGYDNKMQCRGFQYEPGKTYEMSGDPKACSHGFHFCEHPLDVFNYYPPATSVYTVVKGEGKASRHGNDSKVAVSKIHIGAELNIASLTKAAIKFVFDRVTYEKGNQATGNRGAASATGDQGAAVSLGIEGKAKWMKGTWLTIAEWAQDKDWNWNRIDVQTVRVDGSTIKEDTFYQLVNGKFEEA